MNGSVSLLIVYHRRCGCAVRKQFDNADDALAARFSYERTHGIDPDVEVVTITAPTIDQIRRTHSKYFHDEL